MLAVKLEYVKMEFVEVINDFNSIRMSTERNEVMSKFDTGKTKNAT